MFVFLVYEDALIRRFVVVEFKVSFEKSENKITDLDKLTDFRGINRLSSIREAYRNKRFGATMG